MSPRNDPISSVMVRNRDPEKDDHVKEEMAVGADSATLVDGKIGIGQTNPRLGCKVDGWVGRSIVTGWNLSWIGDPESWSQHRPRVHGEPGICQERLV